MLGALSDRKIIQRNDGTKGKCAIKRRVQPFGMAAYGWTMWVGGGQWQLDFLLGWASVGCIHTPFYRSHRVVNILASPLDVRI